MDAHGGMHQSRTPTDRAPSNRDRGATTGQRQLARILRREAREDDRETGAKITNVVVCGVPSRENDVGGPLPLRDDQSRG